MSRFSFLNDPYHINPDIEGWLPELREPEWGGNNPNFETVITQYQPDSIIEVGSWLGDSAIHMASISKADILCVDTWLGSWEWYTKFKDEEHWKGRLNPYRGYPQVYYQFLANVVHAGYQNRITPLPLDSLSAARVVKDLELQPDLVYIDAGHGFDQVLADLEAWYPLAKKAVFGDDWDTWIEVNQAVNFFHSREETKKPLVYGRQWVIEK